MFILDFDDALFDTYTFKKVLKDLPAWNALRNNAGRPEDLYKESDQIKKLLFPDAVPFLKFLKATGRPLILLSFGEANFQKMKIDITGIGRFFDSIHVTADPKEKEVGKIIDKFKNQADIWVINDKIEETKKIIQHFPLVSPVLKMSPQFPEAEYKKSLIPYFPTLTLIQQYVQQQIS